MNTENFPKPTLLIVSDLRFPTKDPVLDTVFSRLLPARGMQVVWLGLSETVATITKTAWNSSIMYQVPVRPKRDLYDGIRAGVSWLRLLVFTARYLRRNRIAILQVRNSIAAGLTALLLSRFYRVRFVYHFSFPVPEGLIEAAKKGLTRMPLLQIPCARLLIALRKTILRHADLVLAQSDEMERQLVRQGFTPGHIFSFPLGTDCPEDPAAEAVAGLRTRLGLDGKKTVLYFGTIHPQRQLDFLVRVAALVHRQFPDAVWLFVGGAAQEEQNRLMDIARELNITDVVMFTGKVRREEVPVYITLAQVSVSPIPTIPLYWQSSPTKTVESLAMGCPVVATDIPDQASLITQSTGGIVVPFDEKPFADAVCRLLGNPEKAVAMGTAGRAFVRKHRSYTVLTQQLAERYQAFMHR